LSILNGASSRSCYLAIDCIRPSLYESRPTSPKRQDSIHQDRHQTHPSISILISSPLSHHITSHHITSHNVTIMRHFTLFSTLLVAALVNAQSSPAAPPPPASSPPPNEPPKTSAPPPPPGAISQPTNATQPAASQVPQAPAPPAISIKEGAPVSPDAPRVYNIMVGGANSNMAFQPESVSAKAGDTIKFMFMDSNNSVVQTTFEQPCQPKQGGFTAGPMPNPDGKMPGPVQDLKIENADPLCTLECLLLWRVFADRMV
jgi:plastocyanin